MQTKKKHYLIYKTVIVNAHKRHTLVFYFQSAIITLFRKQKCAKISDYNNTKSNTCVFSEPNDEL